MLYLSKYHWFLIFRDNAVKKPWKAMEFSTFRGFRYRKTVDKNVKKWYTVSIKSTE